MNQLTQGTFPMGFSVNSGSKTKFISNSGEIYEFEFESAIQEDGSGFCYLLNYEVEGKPQAFVDLRTKKGWVK